MNEIEKAILTTRKYMQIIKDWAEIVIDVQSCTRDEAEHIEGIACSICGALTLGAEALQEKQEREKGCEYCRERKPILSELGDLQIDDTDSTLWFIHQAAADDIYEEHTTIQFCPMCGRKLMLIEGIPEAGKEDMRKSGICEKDIENFDRIVKKNRIKNAKGAK